jgi:hypothetical protein
MVALENGAAAAAEKQMAGLSVANGPAQNGAIVPVGEVRSSLPKPDLAGVVAVESHTKQLGLIYPPPDIRAIVDKTAVFVANHGELQFPSLPSSCRLFSSRSFQQVRVLVRSLIAFVIVAVRGLLRAFQVCSMSHGFCRRIQPT